MFRKSFSALAVALAEAQKLFFDAQSPRAEAAPGSLPTVLEALTEHYQTEGELFTKVALDHVVQLDNTEADSALISQCTVTPPSHTAVAQGATAAPPSLHLVVQLMRSFPNSVEVRERCCRCVANLCHLDRGVASTSSSSTATAEEANETVAERLVTEGAVEQALGTLSLGTRLSPRGRCWAAMAMLNLIVLSKTGAARATAANAEDVIANFILALLEEATDPSSSAVPANAENGDLRGFPAHLATALDASLGALTGVLSAEAPDNAKGVAFNYEKVSYSAVDAITRTLLFASGLLVRDGRNDGAYNASLPSRRYSTVHFVQSASPTQQAAIMALLPLLHKGWYALLQISSHAPNLPFVFDALYEAANTNQESAVMDDGSEALMMTGTANKQYIAALSNLVEAAIFVVTEVEGLDVAEELQQLQDDTRQSIMASLEHLTSGRKDLDQRQRAADTATAAAEVQHTTSAASPPSSSSPPAAEAGATGGEESAFELYPTPAAMGVTDVLASGMVADMALATAVRLHADRPDNTAAARQQGLPSPYTTADFTLLTNALLVLGHLGAVGDAVATSANTVAALQALLTDAAEVLQAMPSVYKTELHQLFRPTASEASEAGPHASSAADAHRFLFLQHAAVVGQTYAVLWGALRSATGVETVVELRVVDTAESIQKLLTTTYQRAIEEAHQRYGVEGTAWVPNTAEESVGRLVRLGDELISNVGRLSKPASQ